MYKVLNKQIYKLGNFSIVPIRHKDRIDILNWRNQQIFHLRQVKPLTEADQNYYFENVIAKQFSQEKPNQILFSFLENNSCIGYGGLVHINYNDKNAEISFIINTELQKDKFIFYWKNFLKLIEQVAFLDLNFHKIFTYAFDLRPRLYKALSLAGFEEDGRLTEHCKFDNNYYDVLIHSKFNIKNQLSFREANINDIDLLFEWVNDLDVRKNSINTDYIDYESHKIWFDKSIKNTETLIYIFFIKSVPIGQVRLERDKNYYKIDYSVENKYRGKGIGTAMIKLIMEYQTIKNFKAIVKSTNLGSLNIFSKLNFETDKNQKISDNKLITFYYNSN